MNSGKCSLAGRACVITGATSGIGRATAVALSRTGIDLALIARREAAGIKLAATLRNQPGAGQVDFFKADLSDQKQVRAVARAIAAHYDRVDVLINNAGAKFETFKRSNDGIELTFATNFVGHFLLTGLLLESLLRADRARVISLGSGAHVGISAEGDWCLGPSNYDRKLAYGKSKLANIIFAYELARRMTGTGVVSNAVDPGGVATQLGRNNGLLSWFRHLGYHALKRQLVSAAHGAETVVHLAADPNMDKVTGKYFYEKREVESSASSLDPQAAKRLWAIGLELTRLSDSQRLPAQCVNSGAALAT